MSIPLLKVIPAGAGSGKTYTIQKTLASWIAQGTVSPERIVAVTFTETAAAELKQRISAELIENKNFDAAKKLDQSYISTIHGFGMRLVTEFAFDAGVAPSLRLLNEDEQKEIIKKALANTQKAENIIKDLGAYGYQFNFMAKKSAEDYFRSTILNTINLLRSLGWNSDSKSLVDDAKDWLVNRCPAIEKDGGKLNQCLHKAVTKLLEKYPASLAEEFGVNKTAKNDFIDDFSNLFRAKDITQLETDWKLWRGLQKLRMKASGTKLPEEYIELAEKVVIAAGGLHIHPGPLEHEIRHISGLLGSAEDVLERYESSKVEVGLLDYTDMISIAAKLLGASESVFAAFKERVDCVIVDEFQDTNPLQFSLIWMLTAAGIPTLIVGDVKQAIMGFQGADPRLFESVQAANQDVLEPLDKNWRTQRPLMEFLNDVSMGLFPNKYQRLTPMVDPVELKPLMVVDFNVKTEKGISKPLWYASHIVKQVSALLDDPNSRVKDRGKGTMRKLIASDIAILAPTHSLLSTYRDVLATYGIRANLQQDGWYDSRVVQLMLAALSWVADADDRHAALYLAVTELGTHSLEEALKCFVKGELPDDTVLDTLDACRHEIGDISVPDILGRVITDLDMYSKILQWPDAEQARANLLKLQAESYEFVMMHKETLASGGFYGSGIQTFLAWLKSRAEDNDLQPSASVMDENAVVLKTWHASKGLEWPVVVVAGLYKKVKSQLPDLTIGYHSFEDLSEILKRAQIEFSPDFVDPINQEEFMLPLIEKSVKEAHRLLYVAITRAREKLILEWPQHLDDSKAKLPHYWKILRDASSIQLDIHDVIVEGKKHSCDVVHAGEVYAEGYETGKVDTIDSRHSFGRIALVEEEYTEPLTPSFIVPSNMTLSASGGKHDIQQIEYGDGLNLDLALSATEYGDFLHRCIECLLVDGNLFKTGITQKLLNDKDEHMIVDEMEKLKSCFEVEYPESHLLVEMPISGLDINNVLVTGVIDLVIETGEGYWIIDHKSDNTSNIEESFAHHLKQLQAYQSLLNGVNGKKVLGLGINWVRQGNISMLRV